MATRTLRILLPVLALALAGGGFLAGFRSQPDHVCPVLESTPLRVDDPRWTIFVARRVCGVEWTDSAGVLHRGTLTEARAGEGNTVILGERPFRINDDHGRIDLRLVGIADGRAIIAYQAEIDHRPDGQNMRRVEGGVVRMAVTERR